MADIAVKAQDCKERVALDLAIHIYQYERAVADIAKDRTYWLKLFQVCRAVVYGASAE
jgi:hypothetical protein